MTYETVKKEAYTIILLTDDVDMSSSSIARKQILDALSKSENVMVDLSKVTYIDSSGVASLVEGFQTAKSKKCNFYLIGVSEAAMMVFKLARLDKVFPIFDTFEQALKN
ncbi:MAG: STAS domain-containing protein [Gammaproteobacteria bacterium]